MTNMEEKEALLYREPNFLGNYQKNRGGIQNGNEDDLSSEASDEWWDESESSCSSCCGRHSRSSLEWEKEVNEFGQLFYIESDIVDTSELDSSHEINKFEECHLAEDKIDKVENVKSNRILNWMRKRDGKNVQVNKSIQDPHSEQQTDEGTTTSRPVVVENGREFREILLKLEAMGQGRTLSERLLGLSLGVSKAKEIVVTNINFDSPVQNFKDITIGDIICEINNYSVTHQNVELLLQSLSFPCEVTLKIQKVPNSLVTKKVKFQSPFVQSLVQKNDALDAVLLDQPVGVVVVDVESQNLNKDDVIYCYPEKCTLSSCRGAFVTLYHLLTEIKPNDTCQSSSIIMKKQKTHVLYSSDKNFLMLLAIPQTRCTLKESTDIFNDLLRNLLFNHQTLKRCFEVSKKSVLDKFFSIFFTRILSNGFLADASQFAMVDDTPLLPLDCSSPQFEDIMPCPSWVPLPKEAQAQIDEALNELEANDFDVEDGGNIENQKKSFNIIGSCLFHKGYLLTSHLAKDDLIDIFAFYRQNCLIQLFRNEPVKSLVIWREVYPLSVNRGLPNRRPTDFSVPSGRWFMLTVGKGYDSLTVILVSGEFCTKVEGHVGPSVPYVEEVEDTLSHIQKLGISTLASQWIDSNSRFKTITPEEIFTRKINRKKENLLGFVKTFDGTQKAVQTKTSPAGLKSGDTIHGKRPRSVPLDTSEDSVSQTPSNVSEISDENAPILGRRGERVRTMAENVSDDTDSSDSEWDSSRDSNLRESLSSSGIDNIYLCDVGEILPARLTTGTEDILFYYVHIDGAEGVLINPPLDSKSLTPKMKEILVNFRRSSQIIHFILENNIKFKKNSQDHSKGHINKSLVAVKEHGVLFECFSSEPDSGKKPTSFTYWIVGRLFFTPQPREIYVCYYEEAPQNLVEIAFRLGLSAAG